MTEKPPVTLKRLLELRHTVVDDFILGPLDREDNARPLRTIQPASPTGGFQ